MMMHIMMMIQGCMFDRYKHTLDPPPIQVAFIRTTVKTTLHVHHNSLYVMMLIPPAPNR